MRTDQSYYVYVIKDSRINPARPFYIGKGTGIRKEDHLINIDSTPKGRFIKEILEQGYKIVVSVLCDQLTEMQAVKIEAELISAFGTDKNGGLLKNTITPAGLLKGKESLNIPHGIFEQAQLGLDFLKKVIFEFIEANPKGVKNAELARHLGLQSDNRGKRKDYLTYSILGILLRDNKIFRDEITGRYKSK